MRDIDGSTHSGSGTILRYAVALATLKKEKLRIRRIRSKRPKPGLRAQHLSAVKACAAISGGHLEGAQVGSEDLLYVPGSVIRGGRYEFDIGTAGSATMAAFTLIPPALFASQPSRFVITGGLFQDFAPSFFHMQHVLLPLIGRMGGTVQARMTRPGYVPKGGGRLTVDVTPCKRLKPLRLTRQGNLAEVEGIAIASHLRKEKVSRRMAGRCNDLLYQHGYTGKVQPMDDSSALQRGAGLAVWTRSDTNCILGSDRAGKPGRRSEAIADFVVRSLLEDVDTGASTDRHLADQLILFAALADGVTRYTIPRDTDHVRSNLWLVEEMLGALTSLDGTLLTVEGIGSRMHE